MFAELKKYTQNNHFFFKPGNSLQEVCNAPTDKSGVYVVYALKRGRIELIYIGRSGKVRKDGTMFIRKSGLGGLKDRLVNGRQFGTARKRSWKTQMLKENIEALDVYWYVTHNDKYMDCPEVVEDNLLQGHFDIFGHLPRWNNEF